MCNLSKSWKYMWRKALGEGHFQMYPGQAGRTEDQLTGKLFQPAIIKKSLIL